MNLPPPGGGMAAPPLGWLRDIHATKKTQKCLKHKMRCLFEKNVFFRIS